jgi:xanthosine utilization system XapX-like protein
MVRLDWQKSVPDPWHIVLARVINWSLPFRPGCPVPGCHHHQFCSSKHLESHSSIQSTPVGLVLDLYTCRPKSVLSVLFVLCLLCLLPVATRPVWRLWAHSYAYHIHVVQVTAKLYKKNKIYFIIALQSPVPRVLLPQIFLLGLLINRQIGQWWQERFVRIINASPCVERCSVVVLSSSSSCTPFLPRIVVTAHRPTRSVESFARWIGSWCFSTDVDDGL